MRIVCACVPAPELALQLTSVLGAGISAGENIVDRKDGS